MPHEIALYLAITFLVFAGLREFSSRSTISNDQARLARMEAKLNLLLDQFGIEHDAPIGGAGIGVSPPSSTIRDLILQGKKIDAIKAYRDQNPGVGLKDAKDAVEAIEAQLKAESYR